MNSAFNALDLIFFTFTAIFILTAIMRGFVKEIFALLNWVLALTISYLLAPHITDLLSAHFSSRMMIDLVSRSGVFIVVFLITAASTSGLRESLQKKIPRAFNKSLGLLYGFGKSLLIFGLISSLYFNLYGLVMGNGDVTEPAWLQESKSRALIKGAGDVLDPVVQKFFSGIAGNFSEIVPSSDSLSDKINDVMKEKAVDAIGDAIGGNIDLPQGDVDTDSVDPVDPLDPDSFDTGYSKKNIEKLNQLMEIINK